MGAVTLSPPSLPTPSLNSALHPLILHTSLFHSPHSFPHSLPPSLPPSPPLHFPHPLVCRVGGSSGTGGTKRYSTFKTEPNFDKLNPIEDGKQMDSNRVGNLKRSGGDKSDLVGFALPAANKSSFRKFSFGAQTSTVVPRTLVPVPKNLASVPKNPALVPSSFTGVAWWVLLIW